MKVRARSRDVTVITFPATDAVLPERVAELVERLEPPDDRRLDAALENALRPVHPNVATRWRDRLAGFGDRVLYVFRDGTMHSSLDTDDWITREATARVVTDEKGQYIDANAAAEDLFGVSREAIIGARAGAFTEPDARIVDADALWRALRTAGRLDSLAVVRRPDGSTRSVEFITVRDGDGPACNVTYLRAVS